MVKGCLLIMNSEICNKHKTQRGVVLFIALIALVVMSLAAVALIRSVDTNSLISGNLAFKQSATISADSGLESAVAWLSGNASVLTVTNAVKGYYAKCSTFDAVGDATCAAKNLLTTQWVPGTNSSYATGTDITAAGVDLSGNTIEYIIQRMCDTEGTPDDVTVHCLYGGANADPSSTRVKSSPESGAPLASVPSPAYRVTAKVTGPKNTVSFIQAFVY